MKKSDFKEERVIDRLLAFVEWAKAGNMVKSRSEFEKKCGLSNNYLYNTQFMTKKSIGTDFLQRIHNAFPMLNLTWVIMGKGSMIDVAPDEGYREAYENLRRQVRELKRLMDKIDTNIVQNNEEKL